MNAPAVCQCRICKRELPLDAEHFQRRRDRRTGFRSECKECVHVVYTTKKSGSEDLLRAQWRGQKRRWCKRHLARKSDPEVIRVMKLLFLTAYVKHGFVSVDHHRIRELTTSGFISA